MSTFTVTPFLNETSRFDPYSKGDTLTRSQLGMLDVEATDPKHAASRVFEMLNRDDRPNGHTERSLSVGDVLRIEEWTPWDASSHYRITVLAVEPCGFAVVA